MTIVRPYRDFRHGFVGYPSFSSYLRKLRFPTGQAVVTSSIDKGRLKADLQVPAWELPHGYRPVADIRTVSDNAIDDRL